MFKPWAQNIANRRKLQGSDIYQSSYLLYEKGGKAKGTVSIVVD